MQKWEYVFMRNTEYDNVKSNSNKLGLLGWELIGVFNNGDEAVLIFKRPLKD